MIYKNTPDNIIYILRKVGALKKEQLIRFFSDAEDSFNVPYYIEELIDERVIDYNEKYDILSWHNAHIKIGPEMARDIKAFWIPASFKSSKVLDIIPVPYPSQFLFITHDNKVYDITVCDSELQGMMAESVRKLYQVDGMEDEVFHIAVINHKEDNKEIAGFGFDAYCIYNRSYEPKYYEWE